MFWRFGGYANISTIDTILDKENFTLEELLDESDLIQELKQPNSKLIEYLRDENVLEKLLDYAVAPRLEVFETTDDRDDESGKGKNRLLSFSRPRASSRATETTEIEDDEADKKRNRYAFVSCEILSSDTWSIYEALTENSELIRNFWNFLQRESPLDPLQASYFTKINESLFEKKTEEMMDLLRSLPDPVGDLLKHVECPMVMDLLLKIIALDRNEGGQGVVEWLHSKNIIPTLLAFLSPEHSWVVQTAAGDFIKAIITISANASQNEQQCIGPNELTRQLVSRECVERLVGYMLGGGNALTVGVGIIIEVIRKNNSDYDPDVGAGNGTTPSAHDPIYLGTLLRLFAENVPKFMDLVLGSLAEKERTDSTFGQRLEPLGFDRFKTCELMAELLHCSNMGLLNEVGSEQLIAARDAERQRMRDEGNLGPHKEEDVSTDNLTMRSTQPVQDEGRRLEVTNADDDGFEEVEPSKEMSEDTSHEFVKAEAETPSSHQASLLGKDDDDFVDEPLSPTEPSSGVKKPQFDDPELVVAPLSPTKQPATQPTSPNGASETQSASNEAKEVDKKAAAIADGEKQASLTSESLPDEEGLALPVTGPVGGLPEAPVPSEGLLSPHPEDTPAPLFSAPSAAEPGAATSPQISTKAMEDTQNDQSEAPSFDEHGDKGAAVSTDPVVGDFLKMQFVDHNVVPTILSFFFSYPWNNFLHNVVYDIVQQVFNGPMDRGYNPTLAISLFEAADITAAIIKGQQASDESHTKTKTRMGYMGHLTLIAEEVVKFTERHPPELLSDTVLNKVMSEEWINYVEGALAETRERDNAILGGVRPEVALGHRGSLSGAGGLGGVGLSGLTGNTSGGQSSALSDAGLNGGIELNSDGGGNGGIGPFAISAGTLMSGFGSSSDEDDEEGDGDEEDINSEFRAYTDPSNADSSLAPPSIPPPPPPPPPLNIPPSRARRQLAARLALHQKNNQTVESSSASHRSDDHDEDDNDDDLKDPFADGEDDLDDDDDMLQEDGRDSWWRGVVRRKAAEEERNSDEDNDDEFGDFAMAEDNDEKPDENVVLRPLAVNPAKDGNRSLSGLWPFSTRSEQAAPNKKEPESGALSEKEAEPEPAPPVAVEVKEAKRRTSIEDPDEDEPVRV